MLCALLSAQRIAVVSVSIVLAFTTFARAAALQQDSETLTNADVIKMVQAHLGADVIVNQIQTQPGNYSLSTSSLIQLKQAGVPDKVVEAMQAKVHGSAAPAASKSSSGAGGLTAGREYTVAEFSRILPGILSKAAVAHGLDAHAYDKDAAYIKQTLETCALDTSNLSGARPDPSDPRFEICQRNPARHLTVAGMKDISVAAENPHNPKSPLALGRGDLLMSTGDHNTRWWPGEKYVVTIKIFMDWGPAGGGGLPGFRFEDVLSGVPIKGLPPAAGSVAAPAAPQKSSVPFSATQGAPPSPAAVTAPARQSGAPFNLGVLDAANLTDSDTISFLNFIRLVPHAIEDDAVLAEFIRVSNLNSRDLLAQHMANEFDRPQILAYYRSNAGPIAAQAPSVVTARSQGALGDYDLSHKAFPIVSNSQVGWSSGDGVSLGSFSGMTVGSIIAPAYRGGRVRTEVDFQQFTLSWVPVSETVARQVIGAGRGRGISLILKIQILQQPPQVEMAFGKSSPHFHFAGKVLSVDVIGPTNEALATIDMNASAASAPTSPPPSGGGPSAPQNGAIPAVSAESSVSANAPQPAGTPQSAPQTNSKHSDSSMRNFQGYTDSCNAGDAKGCEMEGFSYEHGLGVDKDIQIAVQLYEKACTMGRKPACTEANYWRHKLAKEQ